MSEDHNSYKALKEKLEEYEKRIAQLESKLHLNDKTQVTADEGFLAEAEILSNQGSWKWDILNNKWSFSKNWLNIHGIESPYASMDELMEVPHPEDRDGINKVLEKSLKTKQSITAEGRIIKKNTGELRWIRATTGVKLNKEGEPIGMVGVARDITEEKNITQKLLESSDFLKRTSAIAKVGGWDLSHNFERLYWTEGTYDIHELPYDQTPNLEEAINFYHPDDQQRINNLVTKAINTGKSYSFEARIITAKGNLKWVFSKGEPEMDNGKCVRLSGIFQDITETKKINSKVDMLTNAIYHAQSGFDIVDHTGKFIYVNKAHSKMFGYNSPEEILGTSPKELSVDPKFPEQLVKNLQQHGEYICELKARRKDGSQFDLLMHSRMDYDENGNEIYPSSSIDITESLRQKQELVESKQKFESIFKNSSIAKVLTDNEGNFKDINNKTCELLGYSFKELSSSALTEIIYVNNAKSEKYLQLINKNIKAKSGEVEIICKNKEIRIVEYYSKKISENRHLISLIDITEKRKNEEEKRKAQQQVQDIINSIPGSIFQFVFHKDGSFSMPFLHSKARNMFGLKSEKIKDPKFFFSRIYEEDYKSTMHSIFSANHDKSSWNREFRVINKDNQLVWIHAHSYGTADEKGNVIHNGVFYDITKQKEAENRLRETQQQYHNIEKNIPGVVSKIRLNVDGTDDLLYLSQGALDLFEIEPEKALENTQIIWDKIHKDDLKDMISSFQKSAQELSIWEFEYRLVFPDGRIKWVDLRGVPTKQEDGSVLWDTIGLDITKRKQAEKDLEQINKNLEQIVEERAKKAIKLSKELELYWLAAKHAKSGVWYYDVNTNMLTWDNILYDLFGIDKDEFANDFDAWKIILHPEDREKTITSFLNSVITKKDMDSTFRIRHHKTGELRHIRGKGKVKLDDKENPIAVFGTNWDITFEMQLAEDRKLALNNLKKTQEQLVETEKMASLGILTEGVAHELNNPLNYIMGGHQAILEHIDENSSFDKNEIKEYLSWIKSGSDRATKIVKSLNLLSRSNKDYFESCDIHSIINDNILLLRSRIKNKIRIKTDFSTDIIKIKGNNKKLYEAFFNLLFNAIDAIENKGTIEIKTKTKKDSIIITIIDDGCGILEKDLKNVMDPFYTTKPPGKGTGLGLSITNSIIKEHNGNIKLISKYGVGTKVKIEFPK